MTAPAWLRPWPEVRDVFMRQAKLREQREREALAHGIQCRPKRERKEAGK